MVKDLNMSEFEYVIVGDTEKYKGCLVYVCGISEDRAKEVLDRMINNPTENDKTVSNGHINLRIEKVPKEDCWWNGYLD